MSTIPEAAPGAVLDSASVNSVVDGRQGLGEDGAAALHSEGEVSESHDEPAIASIAPREYQTNGLDMNDATHSVDASASAEADVVGANDMVTAIVPEGAGADLDVDANSDGEDVDTPGDVDEDYGDDVGNDLPVLSPAAPKEDVPDTEPVQQHALKVATDENPSDGAERGGAVDTIKKRSVPGFPPDSLPESPLAADEPATVPSLPPADVGDAEKSNTAPDVDPSAIDADADADTDADADADADAGIGVEETNDDNPGSASGAARSPSPLPYIDDIAMLDTGEPGEIRPSAPTESSFTSSIQAPKASTTSVDQEDKVRSTADDNGPAIDFDKMIDAISADAAKPSVTASKAPIGAPKGPSNPFPRPPTGPARMTGRYANNPNLPKPPAAAATGTVGGVVPPVSLPNFPAVGSRRGQAGRAIQGQPPSAPRQPPNNPRGKAAVDRAYQAFLNEEKIHVAEGKWEAFPEGSRMFVGNLSQERVSKRDVFEKFHHFGRLAQISIKSAYGFVQYHSADEAAAAMKALEGVEIRGRKIHLEISKLPTKDKGRERGGKERSPEQNRNRGGRDREVERYDDRSPSNSYRPRDDHSRGSKEHYAVSPRHDRGWADAYNQEQGGQNDHGRRSRGRSRSPTRRGNQGIYRSRRSPSPYYRERNRSVHSGQHALKTRYGGDVPDVQFLVAQELDREFIKWAQAPFLERGLKTDVTLMAPHMPPRDSIIQVHVLEGVTAVVDLDLSSQNKGKIPVQVFNRSASASNVRFDGYQDLAPPVAADVVLRARSAGAANQMQQYPAQHAPYTQNYHGAHPNYGPPHVPSQSVGYSQAPPPTTAAPVNGVELAALLGQLDNSTLAQVLGALQASQAAPVAAPPSSASYGPASSSAVQYTASPNNTQQAQLAALLGTLGAAANPPAPAQPAYGSAPGQYVPGPPSTYQAAAFQGVDEQTIQALMIHLARPQQ